LMIVRFGSTTGLCQSFFLAFPGDPESMK
jgi:hypothetical protein